MRDDGGSDVDNSGTASPDPLLWQDAGSIRKRDRQGRYRSAAAATVTKRRTPSRASKGQADNKYQEKLRKFLLDFTVGKTVRIDEDFGGSNKANLSDAEQMLVDLYGGQIGTITTVSADSIAPRFAVQMNDGVIVTATGFNLELVEATDAHGTVNLAGNLNTTANRQQPLPADQHQHVVARTVWAVQDGDMEVAKPRARGKCLKIARLHSVQATGDAVNDLQQQLNMMTEQLSIKAEQLSVEAELADRLAREVVKAVRENILLSRRSV